MFQTSKKKSAFWPSVDTLDEARDACRNGGWGALFVAAVTGVIALLSAAGVTLFASMGLDVWSLLDAGLFAALAWGLFRCSRAAAVLTLALYLFERLMALASGQIGGIPLVIVLTLVFIGSARGAFAYHRLKGAAAEPIAT
jgi:hypothetical protein